eukprot:jgi/Galph1/5523/GphlegSOOS_G4148.1
MSRSGDGFQWTRTAKASYCSGMRLHFKSVSRSSGHRNKWTESDDYDTSAKDSPKETTNVLEQNEEENGSPSSTKEEQPDSCDLSISQLKFLYTKVPVVDCDFIPFAVVKLFNGANFPAETLERNSAKDIQ